MATTNDVTSLFTRHLTVIRYMKGGAKNDTATAHQKDVPTVRGSVQARLKDFNTDLRDYLKANE